MKKIRFVIFFLLLTQICFTQTSYKWYTINVVPMNENLYSVNANSIVGSSGLILYSSNSGSSWMVIDSGGNFDLHSLSTWNNYEYAAGTYGALRQSTNNGISWSFISLGTNATFNSVSRPSAQYLYVVGNSGAYYYSTNSGINWSTKSIGTTVNLNSVAFTGWLGWVAGAGGTILHTTDFGNNWTAQTSGTTNNLNQIFLISQLNLWVVGDNGKILKTTNGGNSWTSVTVSTSSNLKAMTINASGYGWITGTNGTILRSTSGGLNWILQDSLPSSTDFNSVYFQDNENGIVVGNNGVILLRRPDTLNANNGYLDGNNISSVFYYTGVFNQNMQFDNSPGFEWPKGSGHDAIFTTGLTSAAMIQGILHEASVSYHGEYLPGYVKDTLGIPQVRTDSTFKIYKVKRTDNTSSHDWQYWARMVPYGAPYVDVNHNGVYEPSIDTPGIKNAAQTIFMCLTDGFPERHSIAEGFGGGTEPMFAEMHMTAWCYDNPDLMDVQFIKWDVINKNVYPWNGAYFSVVCDPDLGCGDDDFIGCDTSRNLGFCYNSNELDCQGTYRYPDIVPAVGILWLRCMGIQNNGLSSFDFFSNPSAGGPACERDPNPNIPGAYSYMRGQKIDGSPWLIPPGGDPEHVTKYCYSGDPETGNGWCEKQGTISGSVQNCGGPGIYTGNIVTANTGGDRRFLMNTGSDSRTLMPGDTQKVLIAQLIAQGTDRRNSVTRLKILADTILANCSRGFIIGAEPISTRIPNVYTLAQNYPNPFNPETVIRFQIPKQEDVKLVVYDILGKEVMTLVNEKKQAGEYKVEFDGTNFASGIYFYKITSGDFSQTRKMVLIK